ncbi:MAG: hypothetical protein KDE47_18180, partial [Caldilineaceae bacterium]|nr:hypothetical protein [Caldilineaceae bacterium]
GMVPPWVDIANRGLPMDVPVFLWGEVGSIVRQVGGLFKLVHFTIWRIFVKKSLSLVFMIA